MKFSMTGQVKGVLLIQVTAWAGLIVLYMYIAIFVQLYLVDSVMKIEF